jgi:hypothetical protein
MADFLTCSAWPVYIFPSRFSLSDRAGTGNHAADLSIMLEQRTAISGFFLPFVFSQPVVSTSFFPASTFAVVLYLLHYFTFLYFTISLLVSSATMVSGESDLSIPTSHTHN